MNELEEKMNNARAELIKSDLDLRIQQLTKHADDQNRWIRSYEDEVNRMKQDVLNIGKIRSSLPDGCFRRIQLEPT